MGFRERELRRRCIFSAMRLAMIPWALARETSDEFMIYSCSIILIQTIYCSLSAFRLEEEPNVYPLQRSANWPSVPNICLSDLYLEIWRGYMYVFVAFAMILVAQMKLIDDFTLH